MLAAGAAGLGLAAPAPAAVVARERATTPIDAYAGHAVWSSYDRRARRYRLVAWYAGKRHRLPVAPRRTPFDADLGADERGGVQAVYSRCRREPTGGCDLYRYSFATRTERRLAISSPRGSEGMPTVSGRHVAFVRYATVPRIYVGTIGGEGHVRRLRGGTRERNAAGGDTGPASLDLAGSRLAVAWVYEPRRCGGRPVDDADTAFANELWLYRANGGRRRLLGRGCDLDATADRRFDDVSLAGARRLAFTLGTRGGGFVMRRLDTRTGRARDADLTGLSSSYMASVQDGRWTWVVLSGRRTRIERHRLRFAPARQPAGG
ncbi:MAG TPA: hypothetical protein VF533_17200 [Solirubrobacteraceae bacterium]